MKRIYLPPLLRGIGTTIVLVGTIIAFLQGNRNPAANPQTANRQFAERMGTITNAPATSANEATNDEEDETVADEVLGNRYFEWLGFIGTAIIAGSFCVAILPRPKND